MRPVNLIPKDERPGRRHSRTGPLAYIVIAGLFALLAGVVVLVLSSNQISERESELTELTAQKVAAQARADRLEPYAKFQQVARQRTATISQLADSRFDWPSVLRQFSLIVPKYVLLTKMIGSAGQGLSESGGGESSGGSTLAGQIKGPSLSLEGCAANQKRVAALVASLRQIDGVTRVGLSSSVREIPEPGSSSGGSNQCAPGLAVFSVVVAFDAAPASPDSAAEGEVAVAPTSEESSESESSGSESSGEATSSESGVSSGAGTTVSKTTTVTPPAN
jgi:Tfp pilus assembly protein PilN